MNENEIASIIRASIRGGYRLTDSGPLRLIPARLGYNKDTLENNFRLFGELSQVSERGERGHYIVVENCVPTRSDADCVRGILYNSTLRFSPYIRLQQD